MNSCVQRFTYTRHRHEFRGNVGLCDFFELLFQGQNDSMVQLVTSDWSYRSESTRSCRSWDTCEMPQHIPKQCQDGVGLFLFCCVFLKGSAVLD